MKLWQRYFFFETLKTFLFILGAFYLLFVIIDYSLHTKLFGLSQAPLLKMGGYYLAQFSKRATLLIPFSLLLATVRVLTTLTIRGETIALLSSGVPMGQLLKPLMGVAACAAIFLYLNAEILYPTALRTTKQFEESYFQGKKTKHHSLSTVILEDESILLFPAKKDRMQDIYWIQSPSKIVHIDFLIPPSTGEGVDFLERQGETYRIVEHLDSAPLPFSLKNLPKPLHPPDELPLSQLIKHLPQARHTDYTAKMTTSLHQKLALPLICFFVVLAPAPFCLSFSRQKPLFMIYALSIAIFLSFTTLIDAAILLGEHQTINPFWAIWTPILALGTCVGLRHLRLGKA